MKALADLLWWDAPAEGSTRTLINKDGRLMACLRFRGPDLHGAMDSALVVQAGRLNNLLARLGDGWGLLSEARRLDVCDYPPAEAWAHPVAAAVDAERRATFTKPHTHFVTESTLTLTYQPPGATAGLPDWKPWLYKNLPPVEAEVGVIRFEEEVLRQSLLLKEACEEVQWLEGDDLMAYLHSTISWKRHGVRWPDPACYLDAYLPDTDLERVFVLPHVIRWPRLGERYLRCVSAKVYPQTTEPGMLDVLDTLPIEYRATVRMLALSREKAVSEARKYGDAHYGKRTRAGGSAARIEKIAVDFSEQASTFQAGIEHGHFSAGLTTQTVVVWDEDFGRATEKARMVEGALNAANYIAKIETMNTLAAWDGTIPGNVYANKRQPPMTSQNLARGMLPVTTAWRGPSWNAHLNGPPLMLTSGRGHTPLAVDTYDGDVGHLFGAGPIGSGKSTIANLMALQWIARYYGAQVRIFEIGESFRCATYAVGGQWWDVGAELARVFHTDGHLDDSDFQPWATTWEPPPHAWQCFELGSLMKTPAQVPAVVRSITRAIERQLTGAPTLIIYDEAWKYVKPLPGLHKDASAFVEEIDDQLRALRKLNGMVAYWTQSLADMARSPLADIMAESCKTKIFLANPEALNPRTGKLYDGYGVNPRQRQIIAGLTPKREYYLKGADGCGVFELLLGPVGAAYCGSGSQHDLASMATMYEQNAVSFPWEWLRHKGLQDQAEALQAAFQEQYQQ